MPHMLLFIETNLSLLLADEVQLLISLTVNKFHDNID